MKILVITPWYPTTEEGVPGIFVRDHALAAAVEHDVRVLHLDFERRQGDAMVPPPGRRRPVPMSTSTPGYAISAALTLVELTRLAVVERFVPDLIHAHVYKATPHALMAARLLRRPWVVTEHWGGYERGQGEGFPLRVARFTFPRADRVVVVSDHLRRVLMDHEVHAPWQTIWNAVDTSVFYPPERREPHGTRFLTVGGLDAADRKNVRRLISTLSQVDGPWTATIVGDGPGRHDLEAHALRLGVAGQVTFAGTLPRHAVAAAMRTHDVLVHASPAETFSIVVAEALCSGMHVIASPTGAIEPMVAATGGGAIVHSELELLHELRRALGLPLSIGERHALGNRAADLLSTEVQAAALDELYRQLVSQHRSTGSSAHRWRRRGRDQDSPRGA